MRYLLMMVGIAVGLAACGKKGAPIPEENSSYPRTYPKPITKEIN